MSVNQLAKSLGITAARLNETVRGRRRITADTALRRARYPGTSAEFWPNLQGLYDLRAAEQRHGAAIARAIRPRETHLPESRTFQIPVSASMPATYGHSRDRTPRPRGALAVL
jgi:addiction module HigA family antidote